MSAPYSKPGTIRHRVMECISTYTGPTAAEVAEITGLPYAQVVQCIANLMTDMRIHSSGPLNKRRYHHGRREKNGAPMKSTEGREAPVRNSLMPNGSPEFWRGFLAEMNTPARLDAGKLK